MGDFSQNGIISTLHDFGTKSTSVIENELLKFSKQRKMELILPCLYSELEGEALPKIVDESRLKKVYLAGPDNLMLLLHTVRAILRDATMSQTAGKIQIEVDKLTNDLNLLADRILKLDKHFDLARKDLDEIKISHRKIENRGNVITSIDVSDKKKLTE